MNGQGNLLSNFIAEMLMILLGILMLIFVGGQGCAQYV